MPNRSRAKPATSRPAKALAAKPLVAEPEAVLHARRCGYLVKTQRGFTHWDCQSAEQWHASEAEIAELIGAGRLCRDGTGRIVPAPPSLPKAGRF